MLGHFQIINVNCRARGGNLRVKCKVADNKQNGK